MMAGVHEYILVFQKKKDFKFLGEKQEESDFLIQIMILEVYGEILILNLQQALKNLQLLIQRLEYRTQIPGHLVKKKN